MAAYVSLWTKRCLFRFIFQKTNLSKGVWCEVLKAGRGCSTLSAGQISASAPGAARVRLVSHYDSLVRSGSLQEDTQQRAALLQLEQLNRVMTDYTNIPIPQPKDCSQSQPTSELENKVKSSESRIKLCSPEENMSEDRDVNDTQECLHCVCPLYRDWTTATSHNNELQSSGSQ